MSAQVSRGAASEDFEKWIRMASDNKINTTNSWDLALIDYFHDLSLLRENDGINFQKASTTLDGCVKIYSSRVDSAAAETGKLLNGLAASRTNGSNEPEEEEEDQNEEDIDVNAQIRRKRLKNQSNKNTIVEFDVIKIKKMEMEIHVDPLFKKVLTDFDEGGSKSLLINMLGVDEHQKIIFDTTETGSEAQQKTKRSNNILEDLNEDEHIDDIEHSFAGMDIDEEQFEQNNNETPIEEENDIIDVNSLADKYFSGIEFHSLTVCPSVNDLYAVLNQEATSTSILQGLENAQLNNYYKPSQQQENMDANDDDYGFDLSFGAGYDEPVHEEVNISKYPGNKSSIFFDDLAEDSDHYGTTIRELFNEGKSFPAIHEQTDEEDEEFAGNVTSVPDENLLAYFDQNLRNNWAGPDHWKVKKLKAIYDNAHSKGNHNDQNQEEGNTQQSKSSTRKRNEPLTIDFLSDKFPDENLIFETSKSINLAKKDIDTKDTHVLPIDLHYTTRNFINLFQKDKLINSMFKKAKFLDDVIDESVYAGFNEEQPEVNINNPDFFNDDNDNISFGGGFEYDDDVPVNSQEPSTQASQISTKFFQHGGLNYSRVSKKVDIKLLKDNIWDTLHTEMNTRKSIVHTESSVASQTTTESSTEITANETLKFSDVVHDIGNKYDITARKDLSTSFCFICLLHLANENGFTIENNLDNSDLLINSIPV